MKIERLLSGVISALWFLLGSVIVVLAIYVGVSRALFDALPEALPDIEQWFSENTATAVNIAMVKGEWDLLRPEVHLYDLQISSKNTNAAAPFLVRQLSVQLDIPKTIEYAWPVVTVQINDGYFHVYRARRLWALDKASQSSESEDSESGQSADAGLKDLWIRLAKKPIDLRIDGFVVKVGEVGASSVVDDDAVTDQRYVLSGSIQNRNRTLNTAISLISKTGGEFEYKSNVKLGRGLIEDWNGRAWLRACSFQFHQFVPEFHGWNVEQGVVDAEAWFHMDAGRLERVQGSLGITDSEGQRIKNDEAVDHFGIHDLNMKFRFLNETYRDNLKLDVYDLNLHAEQGSWEDRRLRWSRYKKNDHRYQEVQIDYLNWELFSKLLIRTNMLPEAIHSALVQLSPTGQLSDLVVRVRSHLDPAVSTGWQPDFVQLQGQSLGWNSYNGVPEVKGLSGWVTSNDIGSVGNVTIEQGQVNLSTVYDHRFDAIDVDGTFRFLKQDDGWVIESNRVHVAIPEATLVADVGLAKLGNSPINLAVHGNIVGGDVSNIDALLPSKVIKPGLNDWLLNALKNGRLKLADLMWEGPLKKNPYGEYTLGLRFGLDDLTLDYFDGWPAIEGGQATVDVVNGDTFIDIQAGMVSGASFKPSYAEIIASDPKKQPLTVVLKGQAQGAVTDLVNFLRDSPLSSLIPKAIFELDIQGDAVADLDLAIPLKKGTVGRYEVGVFLSNGRFKYPTIGIDLQSIKGELRYSLDSGISVPNMDGTLLGRPVSITAQSDKDEGRILNTWLHASGEFPINQLFDWQGWPRIPGVSGSSSVNVEVTFPWSKNPIEVEAYSSLKGVSVTMPEPFAKRANETKAFRATVDIAENDYAARIDYNRELSGLFRWTREYPMVGHVVWGGIKPAVNLAKDDPGVVMELVNFDVNLSPWLEFFGRQSDPSEIDTATKASKTKKTQTKTQSESAGSGFIVKLTQSDVQLGEHILTDANVSYRQLGTINLALIDSDRLMGAIEWPNPGQPGKVVIDLKSLRYPINDAVAGVQSPNEQVGSAIYDDTPPSNEDWVGEWDGVSIFIDELFMHDQPWGKWEVMADNYPRELVFTSIRSWSDSITLQAKGEWLKNYGGVSRIDGSATLGNVAPLFQGVGQEPLLVSKNGTTSFQLSWPGAPQDFNPNQLSGRADIKLKSGRVNVTSRGTTFASLFGLLNLKGLFKLLKLDFSDVTDDGLSYDTLEGEYLLNRNLLTIGGVELDGNALSMKLSGTIDFKTRKLNQQMDVVLPLTDGLIIPAALTGSLPIIATVFVVERAFGSSINKLTETTYTIKGTIENPEFKLKGLPGK